MTSFALIPNRVALPSGLHAGHCVIVRGGRIDSIVERDRCPRDLERREVDGDLLPGFIDLQVNGGGGVLFNDLPTVDSIAAIGAAHRRFGTTGFLPTLITDDLEIVAKAITAVDHAIDQGVPGVLGIHIEGPFLNAARKGIHDASKMRALDTHGLELLASRKRGVTLVTLAPELAPTDAVRRLVASGVIVAAGHTDASYEQMCAAIDDGLTGVTHLFNAMSPLTSRAPGVVGAALDRADCWCGVIVDGHHVHEASLRIAFRAKGLDRLVLVTDAMPPVGTHDTSFELAGRRIQVVDRRCVAADGTLAGSVLDMATAVRHAARIFSLDITTAAHMASAAPALALGLHAELGRIAPGMRASFALLDAAGRVTITWIDGAEVSAVGA